MKRRAMPSSTATARLEPNRIGTPLISAAERRRGRTRPFFASRQRKPADQRHGSSSRFPRAKRSGSGIFIQSMALLMLAAGAFDRAEVGVVIRRAGVLCMGVLSIVIMQQAVPMPVELQFYLSIAYPLAMGLVLVTYAHFLRDSWALGMAAFVLGPWLFKYGWMFYRTIRGLLKGFDYIVSGLGFFAVAVLVSLAKSGALRRFLKTTPPPLVPRSPEP